MKESRPAVISLEARISDGSAENTLPVSMMMTGEIIREGDTDFLVYRESGEEETEVHLMISDQYVTMNRIGNCSTTMMFRKGRRFESEYETPYGKLEMSVFPREVRTLRGEDSGEVRLEYEMMMQGKYVSSNVLEVKYSMKGNER